MAFHRIRVMLRLISIYIVNRFLIGWYIICLFSLILAGVYADESDVKRLRKKYGTFSVSELKGNKELIDDVLDQDLRMTIRLQIVNRMLSTRYLHETFAKVVENELQKYGGSKSSNNKELLQRYFLSCSAVSSSEIYSPHDESWYNYPYMSFLKTNHLDFLRIYSIYSLEYIA